MSLCYFRLSRSNRELFEDIIFVMHESPQSFEEKSGIEMGLFRKNLCGHHLPIQFIGMDL
jgi:hypothetical protein